MTGVCSEPGCGRRVTARGLCQVGYLHWRRGEPHGTIGRKAPPGAAEAFLQAAATATTDECIPWPFGALASGYGSVNVRGTKTTAHRYVLLLAAGDPPTPAHHAAHAPLVCHNPACVNWRHLRWATPQENLNDRVLDGTDQRGERSSSAKLTDQAVRSIRSRAGAGERPDDLAREFGVSRSTVYDILRHKAWAHVA